MRATGKESVLEIICLGAQGFVQFGMTVPVDVYPPGGDAVEHPSPIFGI
jgi:hypothetical protein